MKIIMFGNEKIEINTVGFSFIATITDKKTNSKVLIDIDMDGLVRSFGDLVPYPKALYRVLCEYDKIVKVA